MFRPLLWLVSRCVLVLQSCFDVRPFETAMCSASWRWHSVLFPGESVGFGMLGSTCRKNGLAHYLPGSFSQVRENARRLQCSTSSVSFGKGLRPIGTIREHTPQRVKIGNLKLEAIQRASVAKGRQQEQQSLHVPSHRIPKIKLDPDSQKAKMREL